MFFKVLKVAAIVILMFFLIKIIMSISFKLVGKDINEKNLIKYSLFGTIIGVAYILLTNNKEGFENEEEIIVEEPDTEEIVEEPDTEKEIIKEEELEQEPIVEEEEELQIKEGKPTEQEGDLKADIQGDLQVLLDDMVKKTSEQKELDLLDEPKPSTNAELIRTELTESPRVIEQDKVLALEQLPVEDTGYAKAMISVAEEEPRPLPQLQDFGGNKYTIKPVEEWLRPNLAEEAVKKGCECGVYSAFSAANWATV